MYDDLAAFYDLIYQDWEASMRWQGAVLADLLPPVPARVLDASAGIGTQALPLAEIGYRVVARDLSRGPWTVYGARPPPVGSRWTPAWRTCARWLER